MTEISVRVKLTGQWIAQEVEIDASSGLYDWLRKRVRLAPTEEPNKLSYKDVKFGTGGTVIEIHPDLDSLSPSPVKENEVHLEIIDLGGFVVPEKFADLDRFLFPKTPTRSERVFRLSLSARFSALSSGGTGPQAR